MDILDTKFFLKFFFVFLVLGAPLAYFAISKVNRLEQQCNDKHGSLVRTVSGLRCVKLEALDAN